jgi:lipopolysaccharide transport system permease protein
MNREDAVLERPVAIVEGVAREQTFDVVVERPRGLSALRPRELWAYRELLDFLTLRDVKVRYKQTAIGVAWAVVQPVLAMILFTIAFGHVARISSSGIPYPIFAYAALVPWYLVSTSAQGASMSLVGNTQLVTKVYFPRILAVASPVAASAVDFAFSSLVLFALMAYYYGIAPMIGALAVPVLFLLATATALGVGSWLAALNVKYRDVRFVVPFLLQLWFFASPILYAIDRPQLPAPQALSARATQRWRRLRTLPVSSVSRNGFSAGSATRSVVSAP